jgi:hypothetical protein
MPWLGSLRQEGHLVTRVVTPRLSPEEIKSEASWVQMGYSHARAVPLTLGKTAMARTLVGVLFVGMDHVAHCSYTGIPRLNTASRTVHLR